MCFKVQCPTCHKATWQGCGKHIESALHGVPMYDRCQGWPTGKCSGAAGSKVHVAQGGAATKKNASKELVMDEEDDEFCEK